MFGVYIHFPYCRSRCPFCDFAIAVRPEIPHQAYADAVLAELAARAPLFAGRRARSIYFGGGTPGLWRADCVARVVQAVAGRFGAPAEVTVECIPGELDLAHAGALRAAGVGRLSLGVESLSDRSLALLGRRHTAAQARDAVALTRAAGFPTFSLDLMFALPGQSAAAFADELDAALALGPPHLSAYELTVEPGTPFARQGVRPSDGAEPFLLAHDLLTAAGYRHYEVSSYALPGHEAQHNSLYWEGGEVLGLGMSAHSFRRLPGGGGERFATTRDLGRYLAAPEAPPAQSETLAAEALGREALWLGLRRLEAGVGRSEFARLYGADPRQLFAPALDRLEREGLVEIGPERLRLTRRGMLVADEVALRFL